MASKYSIGDRVTYVGDFGKPGSGTVERVAEGTGKHAHYRYDVRFDYDGPAWLKGTGTSMVEVPEPHLAEACDADTSGGNTHTSSAGW